MILFIAITLLAVASAADAMPAPIERPSRVSLLAPGESTGIELRSAHTTLTCTSRAAAPCAFESRYTLRNDTGAPAPLTVFADGYRVSGVELTVGGVPRVGELVDLGGDDTPALPAVARLTRVFSIEVAADVETTLVVTGTMRPRGREDFGVVQVSLPTRHPVLGEDPAPTRHLFEFDVAPIGRWAGSARPTFDVQVPPNWELHTTPAIDQLDSAGATVYFVRALIHGPKLRHGGPYVAAGAVVDRPRSFVGRVGYEFGHGMWSVFGLAVDTDFSSRVVVAPTVSGASAGFSCVFPSFGLGIGPALSIAGQTRVGSRMLAEIQFPFVGVVGSLDWFPGATDAVSVAVLGRLSL